MAAGLALAGIAGAQTPDSKTADQVFKNIQQLKGIPADQLMPSMQFIAASLGAECSFCHVQGKMDLDDKPTKQMARKMIAMTFDINKTNFGGHMEVTCYSCHRGAHHPMSVPAVLETDMAAPPNGMPGPPNGMGAGANAASPAATGTVDQILAKYVAALGGADAIKGITSRVMKGSIAAGGSDSPIELTAKAPNKRISVTHAPNGDSITAFDGTAGWMGGGPRPPRAMSPAESSAAGLDADLYLPLHLKELYPDLRVGRPETIAGVECETLVGSSSTYPSIRLEFDKSSGLLMRMVRYAETPLGRLPTQIDYADYKVLNGVKTPYRWTLARPNGRFTIQIAEMTANGPVDDERFVKPAGAPK